jgi:hypothetical protein
MRKKKTSTLVNPISPLAVRPPATPRLRPVYAPVVKFRYGRLLARPTQELSLVENFDDERDRDDGDDGGRRKRRAECPCPEHKGGLGRK